MWYNKPIIILQNKQNEGFAMRKFYGFFDNGKYKVGCNGGTIYVYNQDEIEIARFKGLSCTYRGAFRPNTNVFVAKSTIGSLMVYDLDTLSLIKKVNYTRKGAQDEGFAFSESGNMFYNIEKPILSTKTQLTVYDGTSFDIVATYFGDNEKMFLQYIETYVDDIYVVGFMRGDNGIYDYSFTARIVNGEVKDIKKIQSNVFPITDWSPWDKNDCRYLCIYKDWETHGFSDLTAKSHECLQNNPPKITIKQIWKLN